MRRGRIESETRFASFSSDASTSGTPRTFFDPSSTPMTTVPRAVFANATRVLRMPSGDDKSRLNSRVFPSWRFSSSMSLTSPHFTRKPSSPQDFRLSVSLVCELSGRVHTRVVRMAGGGVMLGSERNPAVLRRRDGADDESSRRVIEGEGQEDHLVGGGGDYRSERPDDEAVAGASGEAWLLGPGGPAQGKAERSAHPTGHRGGGVAALPGRVFRSEHSAFSREAPGGA